MISENENKWYSKRTKVQKEVEEPKTTQGRFKYVKLEDMYDAYYPLMKKHGLEIDHGLIWHDQAMCWALNMIIKDTETGYFKDDVYPIINESDSNQGFGGSQTYAKRKMFSNLMAFKCGEIDDDGCAGRDAAETKKEAPRTLPNPPEKITKDQLEQLHMELDDHPDLALEILTKMRLKSLSELPKSSFLPALKRIQEIKSAKK